MNFTWEPSQVAYAPDPSVHSDPEIARHCPYCYQKPQPVSTPAPAQPTGILQQFQAQQMQQMQWYQQKQEHAALLQQQQSQHAAAHKYGPLEQYRWYR